MPVPTPEDFLTGDNKRKREFSRNIGEDWNIRQVGTFLVGTYKPTATDTILAGNGGTIGASVRRVAVQNVPDAIETTIVWDTEDYDPYGYINTPSGVFTVPAGFEGLYTATGRFKFPVNPTTTNYCYIGGTGVADAFLTSNFYAGRFNLVSATFRLVAGSTINFVVFQDHSAAQNGTGEFHLYRIGD